MLRNGFREALLALALICAGAAVGEAQTARLRQKGTNADRVTVGVGDKIDVEVLADLQGISCAGVSLFISVPSEAFQVVDQVPGELASQVGVQPFVQGALFLGATPGSNFLLPESDPAASTFAGQQLEYSAVLGGSSDRSRTGSGVVATFSLICVRPIENGDLTIDDSPVRETRLVLSDGISERRFRTVQGMTVTVTGIQLRDIPDVVLLPGQADSVQIGSLKSYILSTLAPVDSIRWSFGPSNLDSLTVEIDPVTKVVKITPLAGWKGRRQLVFTATEPNARIPGLPPLSAAEVSTVIVNTPPRFIIEADADGVKRDTVRFREDQYSYLPGADPVPFRAYRWRDLDPEVVDPDMVNPQDELRFAVLTYGPLGAANPTRGSVDQNTHEILFWSRADFSGRDSLKVMVRDGLRGGEDSLRVILEVTNEDDPPVFTLTDRDPKIRMGGTKVYLLPEIATDPDTPIDDLIFSWIDDPGRHFTVDTTRTVDGLQITLAGATDYQGTGRVTFRVADPEGPTTLIDQMILFITASVSAPPDIFPPEIKVDLTPGGTPVQEALDDYVSDPDNAASELAWMLPSGGRRSQITIDENRSLQVAAPGPPTPFIGYEEVVLTVSDPANQSDVLKLRIYSSDGDPVIGGIPDLILDRGESYNLLDLDGYYEDSDNRDEEMFWEALGGWSTANLELQIDPATHLVTFFVPETAAFKTETVVFRVTSPEGTSAADTMLVTIRSGGDPGTGGFRILPLPQDLQVPVSRFTQVLDLDSYTQPADTAISWSVAVLAGQSSIPRVLEGNVLSVFGLSVGTDTLQFTARDTLGHVQTATARLRVYGESEALRLRAIPDVQFIAGQSYVGDPLNEYIEDRQTHPDSLVQWSLEVLGSAENLFIKVNPNQSLFAVAPDTGTAQVILIARNTALGISGRDTVRVIALDPALGNRPLKPFPSVVFVSGQEDSSIVLNDYLPDEFLAGGVVPTVRWTVTGQRITQPIIGTQAPHRLRLRAVGNSVGRDTLTMVADLGGGFRASGPLEVTVMEPVDASTLDLYVVPNAVNPLYLEVFVLSQRALAGTPTVTRNFEASDSTVALRQIESDLTARGVLVWAGGLRLRRAASGTVLFRAQAFTALGTDVRDTTSVTYATAAAGKPLVLDHGGTVISLPAGALDPEVSLLVQEEPAGSVSVGAEQEELVTVRLLGLYPLGETLHRAGTLQVPGRHQSNDGIYLAEGMAWRFLGPVDRAASIETLGLYAVLRDPAPPVLTVRRTPEGAGEELEIEVVDRGSGVDPATVEVRLDGEPVPSSFDGALLRWTLPASVGPASILEVLATDRAGNTALQRVQLTDAAEVLPRVTGLGRNYPNPFNPETAIPFVLAASGASAPTQVRLAIYGLSGQLVRSLFSGPLGPGSHEVRWDGRDASGVPVGSGVYVCRLEVPDRVWSRRMTLLK